MLGPIDYIVVGFKGNQFDGSIISKLSKAVESGVIRIIDLLFVIKDIDGNFAAGEYEDQSEDLKSSFGSITPDTSMPLFTESDLEEISSQMENDTAAAVLVIEQLWAKGLKKAMIDAGGTLIAEGRVHPDDVTADVEEINQGQGE